MEGEWRIARAMKMDTWHGIERRVAATMHAAGAGRWAWGLGSVVGAVGVICVVRAGLWLYPAIVGPGSLALALMLVVFLVAVRWGARPALATTALAVVAYDYYFLPPTPSLAIKGPRGWAVAAMFLVVSVSIAQLSERARRRTEELEKAVRELSAACQRRDELSGYAALVVQAQEEERRRLARELHDDTTQALVALARGIDAMAAQSMAAQSMAAQSMAPAAGMDQRYLHSLGDLARRTLEGVRRACQDLRPAVLDDLGLGAALASLVGAMADRGLPCRYTQVGEPSAPCPSTEELAVYRIVQEALSNALHHAHARSVAVEATYTDQTLEVAVRDDGSGFDARRDPQSARASDGSNGVGVGLVGMRERAALIGADLEIVSAPGKGTAILLRARLRLGAGTC